MKKQRLQLTMLICALALAGSLRAQDQKLASITTIGLSNGRFWMFMDDRQRTCYLVGYQDHKIVFGDLPVPACDACAGEKEKDWWPTLTVGEILKGLDNFYGEPENLSLPIRFALRILAMKVAGKPQPEIEGWLTTYRRYFFDIRKEQSRGPGC